MVEVGKQYMDRDTRSVVTVKVLDTFRQRELALVNDPGMPNPMGIPGIGNYWVYTSKLTPVEG